MFSLQAAYFLRLRLDDWKDAARSVSDLSDLAQNIRIQTFCDVLPASAISKINFTARRSSPRNVTDPRSQRSTSKRCGLALMGHVRREGGNVCDYRLLLLLVSVP